MPKIVKKLKPKAKVSIINAEPKMKMSMPVHKEIRKRMGCKA